MEYVLPGVCRRLMSKRTMISVHKNSTDPSVRFSDGARMAIAKGIQEDDPAANLEYLGMTLRTLNILENSDYGITKLSQLVCRSKDELLAIPNVTPTVLREILTSLSNYDKLDEAQRNLPSMTRRGRLPK